MTILLAHVLLLGALSFATSRRLAANLPDRIMAAALLFWSNIVATSLLLSALGRLNDSGWFFRASLLLALGLGLGVRRFVSTAGAVADPGEGKHGIWPLIAFFGTLLPILAANLAIAAWYEPNNYDTLTYHLPRVMYYLGHNSLAHFETEDFRQVFYPFNFNLLQLLCLVHGAPIQSVNFFDVAVWVLTGLAGYRIARLAGCGGDASLFGAWLTLTSLEVLAQATSTILDLPASAALLCALVFALRWRQSRRAGDALLAGTAAALSAGTKLTVAFFGPAVALLVVVFGYRHWRSGEWRGFLAGVRAWIVPALLAGALCGSFVLQNLKATGLLMTHRMDFTLNKPFSFACALQTAYGYLVQIFCEPIARFTFDIELIQRLNRWFGKTAFAHWNPAHAFSDLYTIPPDLNEDHVFFGFAGPLFLLCALLCLWRDRRLTGPVAWAALLGLGWFATYFATNKWSLYNQRYFVPAIVVLGPCTAAIWDGLRLRVGAAAFFRRCMFYVVAAAALWSAVYYLLNNKIRPLPLPEARANPPKIIPDVPPTLAERLAGEKRVNVTSYGTNERIFPIMRYGRDQLFTSGTKLDPAKYNVFSFWGITHDYIYSNLAYFVSYAVVPVPAKPTAGVEVLGTIVDSPDSFDYLGLATHAADTPATPATSNVLVYLQYNANTNDPIRIDGARVRAIGLNPADGAELRLSAERADGHTEPLLSVGHSDWSFIAVKRPWKQLIMQVVESATGRILGQAVMPLAVWSNGSVQVTGSTSSFATELIAKEAPRQIQVSGLDILEGPYAQWNMPKFRWAKQPVVRLVVPPDARREKIRLTFTTRLQVRDTATLDVLLNGRLAQTFQLEDRHAWHTRMVELPVGDGENVIELRDRAPGDEPDWAAYLRQNPDVGQFILSRNQSPEDGAKWHYESHGKAEGRPLPMKSDKGRGVPQDSLYYAFRSLRVEGFTTR